MTYRELTFMILDLLKQVSSDSHFEIEHIIKEITDVRNLLLKQRYSDIRKEISSANFQSLTIDLEDTTSLNKKYIMLKSKNPFPTILNIASTPTKVDGLMNFSFVTDYKFVFTGYNNWLSNTIYGTILSDRHFYIKSLNPQTKHMKSITIDSIFEDPLEVYELMQDNNNTNFYEILDSVIPLEGNLIPELQDIIFKRLQPVLYIPKDKINDGNDDLSDMQIKTK